MKTRAHLLLPAFPPPVFCWLPSLPSSPSSSNFNPLAINVKMHRTQPRHTHPVMRRQTLKEMFGSKKEVSSRALASRPSVFPLELFQKLTLSAARLPSSLSAYSPSSKRETSHACILLPTTSPNLSSPSLRPPSHLEPTVEPNSSSPSCPLSRSSTTQGTPSVS